MADETSTQSSVGFTVQVTIDCANPHELAAWWAETLRWEVEPQDEGFIRSMIEQGHATEPEPGPTAVLTFADPEGNEFCV